MGEDALKVVAADSGAALLDECFTPSLIVSATSVMVEPPYRSSSAYLSEPVFVKGADSALLIVRELEFCRRLLKEVDADVVHLDMSLRGLNLEELSVVQLSKLKLSSRARKQILTILPNLRKISSDIRRVYGIDVLAIGKESIPIRIAELTCGAYAILYSAERAFRERAKLRLGLPVKCCAKFSKGRITMHSLLPAEHDIIGWAEDKTGVLDKVELQEMLNPCARGFRVLELSPKT